MERQRAELQSLLTAKFSSFIRNELQSMDSQSVEELESDFDEFHIQQDKKFLAACDLFLEKALQMKVSVENELKIQIKERSINEFIQNPELKHKITANNKSTLERSVLNLPKPSPIENSPKYKFNNDNTIEDQPDYGFDSDIHSPSINNTPTKTYSYVSGSSGTYESNPTFISSSPNINRNERLQQRLSNYINSSSSTKSNQEQTKFIETSSDIPNKEPLSSTQFESQTESSKNTQVKFISTTESEINAQESQKIDQEEIQKLLETETENFDHEESQLKQPTINQEETDQNQEEIQENQPSTKEQPLKESKPPEKISSKLNEPQNEVKDQVTPEVNETTSNLADIFKDNDKMDDSINLPAPTHFFKVKKVTKINMERIDNPWWDFDSQMK